MSPLRITMAGIALVATLFAVPAVHALPPNAVYIYYYDENWNQVGEKGILCDGYHYTWGTTTGAAHETS